MRIPASKWSHGLSVPAGADPDGGLGVPPFPKLDFLS